MNLIYKPASPEDMEAVARFWSAHSGWGDMDVLTWDLVFGRTPQGPSLLILAIDPEEGIMGQFLFLPYPVWIAGREAPAYRPFAPIVQSDVRGRDDSFSIQGLIFQMYLCAVEILSKEGAACVYMIPDPRWARLFSMVPFFQTATFPLMSLPLAECAAQTLPDGYDMIRLAFDDARVDELWAQTRARYACAATRRRPFMQWKNSRRAYQFWGLSDGKNLVGAFVSLRKPQDKQIQICDILTGDAENSLEALLLAACVLANREESARPETEKVVEKVSILATPAMTPALEGLGFSKDHYKFTLVVHVLDETIPPEVAAPGQWYASAND